MYIIVNQNKGILHSDGMFYCAFISGVGCNYCSYKRKANAENRIKRITHRYPNMELKVVKYEYE